MTQDFEEVTELDLIYESHDKVDALIELLIEKNIITKAEYEKKLEEYVQNIEQQIEQED